MKPITKYRGGKSKIFPFILPLAFLFLACDNSTVSRAEYDALLREKQEMEAENDSLQFELADLKLYVERLEEDVPEAATASGGECGGAGSNSPKELKRTP